MTPPTPPPGPRFSRRFGFPESGRARQQRTDERGQLRRSVSESSAAEVILSSETGTLRNVPTNRARGIRPCGIFVPENYEPNYAYPLIIWLHEAGQSERDVASVLPQISTRNYLGLALRGTSPAAGNSNGYHWPRSARARFRFEDELCRSVRRLRRDYHVHTERIFLAGARAGGTLAWELFLAHPEWYAGIAVLGGRFPWRRRPLRRFRELAGKRAFLAADAQRPGAVTDVEQTGRLLYTAGLDVAVRCHSQAGQWPRSLFRHIDRWIMHGIGGGAVIT